MLAHYTDCHKRWANYAVEKIYCSLTAKPYRTGVSCCSGQALRAHGCQSPAFGSLSTKTCIQNCQQWWSTSSDMICLRHEREDKAEQAKKINVELSKLPSLGNWPVLCWPLVYGKYINLLLYFCAKIEFSRSYLHIEVLLFNSSCFVQEKTSFLWDRVNPL